MKLKSDPRHKSRIRLIKTLFSWDFQPKQKTPKEISKVAENITEIDELIKICAKDRPISAINKIDLAILRLAIFELIIEREEPFKVIIDEAIELGKEFGSDSSPSFINGVLGKVVKLKNIN